MKNIIITLVALTLALPSLAKGKIKDVTQTPACQAWVDSVYATLNDRERVAQLFIGHLDPTAGESTKAVLRKMVDKNKVGGLLFSKGSLNQYASMINYAQSLADVPLMMTLDGEWGAAMRIPEAPHFPVNMALGAIDDPTLLYQYGREMARECRALGIHVNFAPVLDVNSNPANPVIGQRSFGEDPHKVATLGLYYAMGLEDGGVMAVGKHFPGHGDTNADSHKTVPVITRSTAQLEQCDLVPFKTLIDKGISGMMVGHIAVPAFDKNGTPASMSKAITTDLLRRDLAFDGLIFTDGLAMEGAKVKNVNQCVSALLAGADVLLGPPAYDTDIDAVLKAVASGVIPASRIEESAKKMLAYKYALGLNKPQHTDVANIHSLMNTETADIVNRQLSDACATVISNKNQALPVGNLGKASIAVVNIGDKDNNAFAEMCRNYTDVAVFSTNGEVLSNSAIQAILRHDVVIAAVYSDKIWAQQSLKALKDARLLIDVFMINPYRMGRFRSMLTDADATVTVYYNTPYLQQSAAKAIFGGIDVNGRMPVNVEGMATMGDGISLTKSRLGYSTPPAKGMARDLSARLDSIVGAALTAGAFPGCQLLVAKDGDVVFDRCYGVTTKDGDPVTARTLYDLASVSKAVGTLPGVMKAYDEGLFGLDTRISDYIPELRDIDDKKDLTPRMLLHHESGLPASLSMIHVMMDSATYTGKLLTAKPDATHTIKIDNRLYGNKEARLRTDILSEHQSRSFPLTVTQGIYSSQETYDSIMGRIYNVKPRKNRNYLYSCLNFCLLMDMEQRLTGMPHDMWVRDKVWLPLGTRFCYRAADTYPLSMIAPTEKDPYLRRKLVHGYVHDELAAFSGGVQGNAGVFGSASDVAKLCQTWLNGGTYGDARIFSEATNTLFTTEKSKTCRRGLGFDKPDTANPAKSPTCPEANGSVFGHLGFTGTVFWVDPSNNMILVFLCNRVNPTRDNAAFRESEIRPALMRILYESI